MMDLSMMPVTPQELDAWLRSTEVEDEHQEQDHQDNQEPKSSTSTGIPTLPNLGRQSPSPSPKTESKTSSRQSKIGKRRRNGRRRRSTLDDASAPQFGIDAQTHLMAGRISRHEDNNDNNIAAASRHAPQEEKAPGVIRLVSEDNSNYSPASSINSMQQGVDRDAALSMHPAPMFTMDRSSSSSNNVGTNNNNNQGNGGLPPTMLSRRDSAGSRCSVTCASSDTVHRNNFSSSRSSIALNNGRGYDCVTPLGNSDPSSFQQVEGNNYSPTSQGYARSVSLENNSGNITQQAHPSVLQHSHSLPTNPSQSHGPEVQDLSKFLSAMEQSQKSQGYIHSGPQPPRRSLAMMRETNRSRGMLLSMLSNEGTISRRSSMSSTASQVIAAHNSNSHSSGNRRSSTSSGIGDNMHRIHSIRRMSGMGGGSTFRQQDMRNMMLRSMQMNEEEMHMGMMSKKIEDGSYWRPVSKHRDNLSSLNHCSNYPQQMHHHQQQQLPMCPREDNEFDQESAVKAELQRIAREQMRMMGQQEQQHLLQQQSIY